MRAEGAQTRVKKSRIEKSHPGKGIVWINPNSEPCEILRCSAGHKVPLAFCRLVREARPLAALC